jgi:hypothetical protein
MYKIKITRDCSIKGKHYGTGELATDFLTALNVKI